MIRFRHQENSLCNRIKINFNKICCGNKWVFDLAVVYTVSWHWLSIALLKLGKFIARN